MIATIATTDYQVGDRIYYTGDVANHPSKGVIIKRNEPDRFAPVNYDIWLDEDKHISRGIYHLSFTLGPGQRFWLLSEWEADQQERITQSIATMKQVATPTETRHLTVAETAKLIRPLLTKQFPGVKFSVRSKSYSGGASIDISWTDGPRGKEVDPIIAGFEGASFDGMNDLKTNQESWLLPDGTAGLAHRQESCGGSIPGYESERPSGAERVSFGADYIFTSREVSNWDEREFTALKHIREHCKCEGEQPDDRFGNDWVSSLARRMVRDFDVKETIEETFDRVIINRQ